ncbi:8108_t:CDS:2 [Paraglomus occultum]|uniref:8108_t:CDS:1 n=1 Tax=Paraglomus occultum TaxID=144539 RepID=A0A9N8W3P0_9GLOM|nr:8108_t:CDS:2 [Paraglomus occultum]
MSSDYLCVKIAEYLSGLKTEHIMAATLIYQGLEENPWISKNELRGIVDRAVNLVQRSTTMDFERSGRLIQIIPQFDIAFDSIHNLLDVGIIKTNKEKPLTSEQINYNINKLRGKLANGTSKLYQELIVILNDASISELTWRDPLASQVISAESELIKRLSNKQRKQFMKPAKEMMPEMPPMIQEECNEFVSNFPTRGVSRLPHGLSHTGDWKESEEKLNEVAINILGALKDIWCNPAFHPEFVETLNEGTYVNNVVVPLIHAALFNNPFGESAFITTFERQSNASADRRGDGKMGRRPDIMFQKGDDDDVKLWREANDGMFWAHKSRRLEKGQFGIIGIQVLGRMLRLNVLIRDDVELTCQYYAVLAYEDQVEIWVVQLCRLI